jgi:hypothetical protein
MREEGQVMATSVALYGLVMLILGIGIGATWDEDREGRA